MGQTAAAVVVGIVPDKALSRRLQDEEGEPIWAELPYAKHPETGEEYDCLGFAAILSNGGDADEGELHKSTTFAGFEDTYKTDVARARKKWDTFAAWMKANRGIALPEPTLVITVVERA